MVKVRSLPLSRGFCFCNVLHISNITSGPSLYVRMKDSEALKVGSFDFWRGIDPELSLHKDDALVLFIAVAINADNIRKHYHLLKATLEEYDILSCPGQMYNSMDECGMPLDHKPPMVLSDRSAMTTDERVLVFHESL